MPNYKADKIYESFMSDMVTWNSIQAISLIGVILAIFPEEEIDFISKAIDVPDMIRKQDIEKVKDAWVVSRNNCEAYAKIDDAGTHSIAITFEKFYTDASHFNNKESALKVIEAIERKRNDGDDGVYMVIPLMRAVAIDCLACNYKLGNKLRMLASKKFTA